MIGLKLAQPYLKAGLGDGEEDAVDGDVVAGHAEARRLAAAVDGDGARDVAHRHGVRVLLDLQLLKHSENGFIARSISGQNSFLQGDHSGCTRGCVDIK